METKRKKSEAMTAIIPGITNYCWMGMVEEGGRVGRGVEGRRAKVNRRLGWRGGGGGKKVVQQYETLSFSLSFLAQGKSE